MGAGLSALGVAGDITVAGDDRGNLKVWNVQTGEEKNAPEKMCDAILVLDVTGDIAVAGDSAGYRFGTSRQERRRTHPRRWV